MGKGRKCAKKRKTHVADDEPEFLGTIYPQDTQLDETQFPDTQHEEPQLETVLESHMVGSEVHKDATEQGAEKESAAVPEETTDTVQPNPKKHRGPTKMKDIAKDPNERIRVEFTELGEPFGE